MQPQFHDNAIYHTTYEDYGKGWLVDGQKTFEQLREDAIKLEYLEKCYKSRRRGEIQKMEAMMNPLSNNQNEVNEKYKYDKNAIIAKKFPFKASDFHYPNDGQEKPKSLYITTNENYGKQKPNDLELPDKWYPINTKFTRECGTLMYRNSSLNCSESRSKVHASLDSVV
jgi:hypothetical protein